MSLIDDSMNNNNTNIWFLRIIYFCLFRPVRTCKLAVTDLPSTADEPGLRSRFEQFGGVLELSFENDCAYVVCSMMCSMYI